LDYPHRPVLVQEVLDDLITSPDGTYIDGTVGSGGHSEAIGRRIGEQGRLVCLDRDPEAIRISKQRLSFLGERVRFVKASYGSRIRSSGIWDGERQMAFCWIWACPVFNSNDQEGGLASIGMNPLT